MFIDGAREFMGIGLASMQRSLNSKSDAELDQAYNKLKALTPNAKAVFCAAFFGSNMKLINSYAPCLFLAVLGITKLSNHKLSKLERANHF